MLQKKLFEKGFGQDVPTWPTTYFKATSILKDAGYNPPIQQLTCLSNQHPTATYNYNASLFNCTVCFEKLTIPVYYSPISDKLKRWSKSKTMCTKMT